MTDKLTFGSVCSGIEASQLAFNSFNFKQLWSSEIADFPSKVLEHHYPSIPNVGDMLKIPSLILEEKIEAPDLLCGGTPCQAFSLAGWQNGLTDERGLLTMTFIDIANAIDKVREKNNKERSIVLWENVEGVLNDRTNAFGNFIAGLAGFSEELKVEKWSKSGFLEGKIRNVAWRVLDAKYFGLPQQRKRLFVLAGGKNFRPDEVLFEIDNRDISYIVKENKKTDKRNEGNLFSQIEEHKEEIDNSEKIFYKEDSKFEIFREYTDCLYSAYATKWNGNAAAYNGSLYIAQNDRIRRLIPLECERLMGFPDNYTLIQGNSDTNRYHAVGNSWAVPVVKWIGQKIKSYQIKSSENISCLWGKSIKPTKNNLDAELYLLGHVKKVSHSKYLNSSPSPNNPTFGDLKDIVQSKGVPEKFYISPTGCKGILRRMRERSIKMNPELEKLMKKIANQLKEEKKLLEKKVSKGKIHYEGLLH